MFVDNISTIGVVDSGIGGISIVRKLIKFSNVKNIIYFADNLNMPYGNKSKQFVKKRIELICDNLFKKYNTQKIIIACNTASTCLNSTDERIIKMEFDVSKTYFATNLTKKNAKNLNVIPDSKLAKQIELNILNKEKLDKTVKKSVKKNKLDSLSEFVLGCTHYELVKDIFEKYCEKTNVIPNSDYVLKLYKKNVGIENDKNIYVILSKTNEKYTDIIWELIKG